MNIKPVEIDEALLHDFTKHVRLLAEALRTNAGMNGEHHDGGANRLLESLQCYVDGFYKRPFPVSSYMDDYVKELDPEYDLYKRLKKKFED